MNIDDNEPLAEIAISQTAHPDILEYMRLHPIATYRFDERKNRHSYEVSPNNRRWVYGIHSYLERTYLPKNYKQAKRASWKRSRAKVPSEHKKGADKTTGLSTMTALEQTVLSGGTPPPRINKYAKAILEWLDRRGFEMQVVEMPVILPGLNRVTRADLVTLTRDKTGFVVWEIKCGWPPGAHQTKYKFNHEALKKEACNPLNMFCMQALYTKVGAQASGLRNVKYARVLHVFEAEIVMELETPPQQRKKPANRSNNKETWEKDWTKPVVDHKRNARYQKVMRVVCMDMPKWCLDHEPRVREYVSK